MGRMGLDARQTVPLCPYAAFPSERTPHGTTIPRLAQGRGEPSVRQRGYPGRVDATFAGELRESLRERLFRFERRSIPLDGRRAAAVALALVPDDEDQACFLLTRRASGLRDHAGQYALPGGGIDGGECAEQAALRELAEEVGLRVTQCHVLGLLDDYATRSGFVITPVVVWGGKDPLEANPAEVAALYRIPLAELAEARIPRLRSIPESDRPVISLPLLGTHIHAPTAAILYQLREVALFERDTRVDHYEQPVFAWR